MKRARYHWLAAMALACIAGYAPAHGDMEKSRMPCPLQTVAGCACPASTISNWWRSLGN